VLLGDGPAMIWLRLVSGTLQMCMCLKGKIDMVKIPMFVIGKTDMVKIHVSMENVCKNMLKINKKHGQLPKTLSAIVIKHGQR
jgi:hypothetical protein